MEQGTLRVKTGLAEMLKGGVIMDVTTPEQAKEAGQISFAEFKRLYQQMKAEERRKNLRASTH